MSQYLILFFVRENISFIILRVSMLLLLFLNVTIFLLSLKLIQLLKLGNDLFLRCVVSEGTDGLNDVCHFVELLFDISVNLFVYFINSHVWFLRIVERFDFEFVNSLLELFHHILQVGHFEVGILSSFHIS